MATAIHAVEASGLARFMREALWAYPATEALHIIGIGLLFLDMRKKPETESAATAASV
jgi:hypothetical protein